MNEKRFKIWINIWEGFRELFLPMSGICCVPSALHLLDFSEAGAVVFWVVLIFIGIDVLFTLPRFIRAFRKGVSKPYQHQCFADWLAYSVSILVGVLVGKLVGLF